MEGGFIWLDAQAVITTTNVMETTEPTHEARHSFAVVRPLTGSAHEEYYYKSTINFV
jgi:hypothetical protein